MTFPLPPNTTCDIYHGSKAPPQPPDLPGVLGNLQPHGTNWHTTAVYTHWIDVPLDTDIRGQTGGSDGVYVPDQNGTKFVCVGVERIRCGGGSDFKRAYLNRGPVTWPSNNL